MSDGCQICALFFPLKGCGSRRRQSARLLMFLLSASLYPWCPEALRHSCLFPFPCNRNIISESDEGYAAFRVFSNKLFPRWFKFAFANIRHAFNLSHIFRTQTGSVPPALCLLPYLFDWIWGMKAPARKGRTERDGPNERPCFWLLRLRSGELSRACLSDIKCHYITATTNMQLCSGILKWHVFCWWGYTLI